MAAPRGLNVPCERIYTHHVRLAILTGILAAVSSGQNLESSVKIALAGDSTVAEGGGWGPGFQAMFGPEVKVLNFARNGRSSQSFRDEGQWAPAVAARPDYVLIQFGH